MAVANYESSNGHLPPAYQLGPDGKPWHSWRVLILPFIEGHEVFKRYRFDEPWNGPNNRLLASPMPSTLAFDTRKEPTTTANYLAVVGPETMWPGPTGRTYREVKDSPSDTILIVENNGLGVHWMEPRDLTFRDMSFELDKPDGISSPYRGTAVAMADGSVRSLGAGIAPDAVRALLTAKGGEKLADGERGAWQVIDDGRDRPLK